MNESKPIVTCHGNQTLFSSVHSTVAQGLPREAYEWRRSYGRAPRDVYLEASFVPYDADILPDEEEKTLVSRPYFHIFWTDCDLDTYKQSVKDEISEWHGALKARNIPDWLIVLVTSDEGKMKAKLLPRTSVIDKIKNDFCGKQPDRCIVLTEPNRKDSKDSKSSESWSQLYQRLRSLLLQAFNRHLNKYEESMRNRREKRNEPGWNYFTYFIFQEELAFMLEILGLKEDALVQYDELDAMFDQFVENFASGDTVKWLTPLIEPCRTWAGVSLLKSLDLELREEVKQNKASLLSFRNYLFSRQAALLFQMDRAWEVAQRAMNYLFNTVVEMNSLEIEVPRGAVSCWVFLSCLEVLKACELHNKQSELDEKFALYTANLWDLAHKKLRELGNLCSLMPGLVPTSDQLSLVVDLTAGMELAAETLSPTGETPVDKLRESLSSPESFKRHYLEMCEQAMGTYKYIGRYRSSRMIGVELADFYMRIKEAEKAESFLLDSIRMYQTEGWMFLADGTMLKLAECQRLLGQPRRYLMTACHVACSPHVEAGKREEYFSETFKILDEISGSRLEMRASQCIWIEEVDLSATSAHLNEPYSLTLSIVSRFPKPVKFDEIKISAVKCSNTEVVEYQQQSMTAQKQQTGKSSHRRQGSMSHISLDKIANFQPVKKQLPAEINIRADYERKQGRLLSSSLICDAAHDLLKRCDSAPTTSANSTIIKGDYSHCFSMKDIELLPGSNAIKFVAKISDTGVFRLDQMCLGVKLLDLLKPLSSLGARFEVVSVPSTFTLSPKHSETFVAGMEQEGVLTFTTGSYSFSEATSLSISSTSLGFKLQPFSDADTLSIGPLEAQSSCDIPVKVFLPLKNTSEHLHTCKANLTMEKEEKVVEIEVVFYHPFTTSHKLYTLGKQKYFQLCIQRHADLDKDVFLTDVQLTAQECPDVQLYLMNPCGQPMVIKTKQSLSLVWKMDVNLPVLPSIDLLFTCEYSTDPSDMAQTSYPFTYTAIIQDFQTQFELSYSVASIEEDKSCIAGESAILDICVKHVGELDLGDGVNLAYKVKANGSTWAIGGKSSGVFMMKEKKHSLVLDVVPMQPGYLHMPAVSLYRYLDQIEDSNTDDEDQDSDDQNDSAPLRMKDSVDEKVRTSSVSSVTHADTLVSFFPGQVYNASGCRQVHVYPCNTTADIDLSFVT